MYLKDHDSLKRIAICICTRKRQDGLKKLLFSIENLIIPSETELRVIIIENDSKKFSESLVNDFSQRGKLVISYYLEHNQGIVYARNRAIAESDRCDFCCFTDDDQIVPSNWLIELMKCQREFDADCVAGPTKPVFMKKVPVYIEKLHQPKTYLYGTIIKSAFTGCLLLKKDCLDMLEGPFDLRLNFSGGEDSYLTETLSNLGAIIRFNPDAVAYEIIPENRMSVKYLVRKAFRISNTRLLIDSLKNNDNRPIKTLPRLVMRFCYGSFLLIPCLIFCKEDKLKGLIKVARAFGGLSFFFGKLSQFYKN